jgi:hypothetical protein
VASREDESAAESPEMHPMAVNEPTQGDGLKSVALPLMLAAVVLSAASTLRAQSDRGNSMTRVPLVFSGGHETDPRDRGRPVVLIAAALGVPSDVFREAFSHVRPAPAGTEPDPRQVRANKEALMDALGKYNVTNRRLDTVSNYYRYARSRGELWPTKAARGYAVVENGKITGFVITNGGCGYSSPPAVSVPKMGRLSAQVELSFRKTFEKNGSVSAVTILPER